MVITIDDTVAKTNNVSKTEIILLLFFSYEQPSAQILNNLLSRGLLKRTSIQDIVKDGIKYRLTSEGQAILNSCLLNVNTKSKKKPSISHERLSNLAIKLKEIFPKGKKEGTKQYWAEGKQFIINRLEQFFNKYDVDGTTYTDEQILNAAQSYVNSFNGDYRLMRVLKYFIWKDSTVTGGTESSDLINVIENADQEDIANESWRDSIR